MDPGAPFEPTGLQARGPGVTGTVAALLLAGFWLGTLTGPEIRPEEPPKRLEARLRRLFQDNAPGIRTLAVPMNGLLYLFGERRGSETVFVAVSSTRGGILLFTPEIALERADPETGAVVERNVGAIRERVAGLRRRGVARLLLVPVPTKLSVSLAADPSLRGQVRGSAAARSAGDTAFDGHRTSEAYQRFAETLERIEGVNVVFLQKPFIARTARGADVIFSSEDTHWTSLGLNLAAKKVLEAWRGKRRVSLVRTGRLPDAPGDLQRMLALPDGPWFRTHPMAEDVYELVAEPCADPCPERTFQLGTSYSSYRGQTLAGLLSQASGCAVTDLARPGQGAVASFAPLFEHHAARLQGALVIWEFPFRDLADPRAFSER